MLFSPVVFLAKILDQKGTHGRENLPAFLRVLVLQYLGVIFTPSEPPTSGSVLSTGTGGRPCRSLRWGLNAEATPPPPWAMLETAKYVLLYPCRHILSQHPQLRPQSGYHRVTKVARNADNAKIAEKCMSPVSTPPPPRTPGAVTGHHNTSLLPRPMTLSWQCCCLHPVAKHAGWYSERHAEHASVSSNSHGNRSAPLVQLGHRLTLLRWQTSHWLLQCRARALRVLAMVVRYVCPSLMCRRSCGACVRGCGTTV